MTSKSCSSCFRALQRQSRLVKVRNQCRKRTNSNLSSVPKIHNSSVFNDLCLSCRASIKASRAQSDTGDWDSSSYAEGWRRRPKNWYCIKYSDYNAQSLHDIYSVWCDWIIIQGMWGTSRLQDRKAKGWRCRGSQDCGRGGLRPWEQLVAQR